MPTSSFINATDARRDFFDILDGLNKRPYPVVIVHKSSPQGVLMSWEDYNGWVATMETLNDPELMESIRGSEEDMEHGRYVTLEQVEKEYAPSTPNLPRPKRSKKTR